MSPHQEAVIGLVYGHGDAGLSRPRLIWLLWESDEQSATRHRFSQLLYGINRNIGAESIFSVQGDRVLPNSSRVESDLTVFDRLLREECVADAAAMIARGFLTRLRAASNREYEDWKTSRAATFRSRLRDVAATVWSDAESVGDWSRARAAAETLLALDPDSESYLRCVMKARALSGSPEAAEAAYRAWMENGSTLDGGSEASTRALLDRVMKWTVTQRAPERDRLRESDDPPFVGRTEELAVIRKLLVMPGGVGAQALLVRGEPGIGKSRLAEEVCKIAEIEGIEVLRARSTALEQQIPLNPLIDALAPRASPRFWLAIEEPWRSVLKTLLPSEDTEAGPAHVPYVDPGSVSRRIFEALQRALERVASGGRLLLWIDDAHWVDETTVTALEFILRRWTFGSLVVCLGVRDGWGKASRSVRLIEHLAEQRLQIDLGDLSDSAARELVGSVIGLPSTSKVIPQIVSLGGCNPLFLTELSLDYKQGRLKLDPDHGGEMRLPISIQKILADRLAGLSPRQRKILEVASVCGDLTLPQLQALTGTEESVVAAEVRALSQLRLMRYSRTTVALGHELLRQTLYASLPMGHAAFLHRAVADLISLDGADRRAGELAIHYDRGGDSARAFEYAGLAAERFTTEGAIPEAIRFMRIARRHASDEGGAATFLADEGKALLQVGDLEAAVGVLSVAEEVLRRLERIGDAIACATLRLGALSELGVLESRECSKQIDRLIMDAEELSRWDLFLCAIETKIRVLERAGEIKELRRTVKTVDRVPADAGPEVTCMAHSIRALEVLFGGEGGWVAALAAVRVAREAGLEALIERAENRLFVTLMFTGRLACQDAPYTITEFLDLGRKTGDLWLRVNCYNSVGAWLLDTGNLGEARHYFSLATEVIGRNDESELGARILINQGETDLYEGYFPEGLACFRRVLEMESPGGLIRVLAQAGAGLCALKSGDLKTFRSLSRDLAWDGDTYFECSLPTWFAVEQSRHQGELDRGLEFLRRVAQGIQGRLPLTWLKLALLEIEFIWKLDRETALIRAGAAIELCDRLNLLTRASQFRNWMARL